MLSMSPWLPALMLAVLCAPLTGASELAFKKEGKGPGIVLIHGFGGNREVWTEISKRLKTSHTVLSLNLPGHADNSAPPLKEKAVDLDAVAAEIAKLIRKQKVEPALLVGHSLGGTIAIRVALADPKAVRGVILVDSSLAPIPRAFTDKLEKDLDTNPSAALGDFFGGLCKGETQKARLVQDALKVQVPVLKAYARALGSEALGTRVTAIQVPVTLFASTVLSPDPAKEKESLKQLGCDGIPKFTVSYFVDAWHWIMWDDPDTFEILFNDFETSIVSGASGGGRLSTSLR